MQMTDEEIIAAIRDIAVAFTYVDGDAIIALEDDTLRDITIAQVRKLFSIAHLLTGPDGHQITFMEVCHEQLKESEMCELLPCPFCGRNPTESDVIGASGMHEWRIECSEFCCRIQSREKAEAVKRWNTRA